MATEYIKRDEALSFPLANGKYDHEHANEHFIYGLETYREWLEQLPAISPDEVRGGTWVGIDDFPHESWECDQCGCVVENTDDPWNYFHYCPNCGVRMEVSEDA